MEEGKETGFSGLKPRKKHILLTSAIIILVSSGPHGDLRTPRHEHCAHALYRDTCGCDEETALRVGWREVVGCCDYPGGEGCYRADDGGVDGFPWGVMSHARGECPLE